jgi:hypothetical protein
LSNLWQKKRGVNVGYLMFGLLVWLLASASDMNCACYGYVIWMELYVCGCVCSEICSCLGGADLCYAGGDVGYDAPTSYACVQGE